MNLRHLALFVGLFFISSLTAQVTDNITQGFLSKFNKSRQSNSLISLEYDSTLSVSCMGIEEEYNKKSKLTDDYLRSVLRSNGNFDYNINLVEIETRNIEETLNKSIESINTSLVNILNNPNINRVGVWSRKTGHKHSILLLFTQNYVIFDKYFKYEIVSTTEGYDEYIILSGRSMNKDVNYKLYSHNKSILTNDKSLVLDQEDKFQLRINISCKTSKNPVFVEFLSKDGAIISLVDLNINQ